MLDYLIHSVEFLQSHLWAAPAFVVVFAIVCLTGPITPFPVIAGVTFGFWKGMLLSWIGIVLGSCAAFYLGRTYGRRFFEARLGERYKRIEANITREGFRAVLIMRLVGFPPYQAVNYLAGMTKISWTAFVFATILGILPWVVLMNYFSRLFWMALLADGWRGFKRAVIAHGPDFMAAGALMTCLVLLHWVWKRRQEQEDQRAGFKE